ncbi:MAG: cell division protein [Actinomycetia bacterium]|nr:cell division protein [Actinomycetes bacterium]
MLARFGYFLRETLTSLRRNLSMSIAGVLTVAVSLVLFGGMILGSDWANHGNARWKGGVRLEAFMNVDATQTQIDGVNAALKSYTNVKSYKYLNKQDALVEFKILFANQPALVNNVSPADLPTSFRVAPAKAEFTNQIANELTRLPGVNKVNTPGAALDRKLRQTKRAQQLLIALSIVLLASSTILILNTIRLATFARRREIEVMKLVGASNWFVRVPFMAEGFLQGMLGAVIAVPALLAVRYLLEHTFAVQGNYITNSDVVFASVVVLLIGSLIGVAASALGLRRFLDV